MTMKADDFSRLELGGGQVRAPGRNDATDGSWSLTLPAGRTYADAQLDDTTGLSRGKFLWSPPLRFSIRARVQPAQPLGTFGFGFWNDPFTLSLGMGGAARKIPAAPQCAWFFHLSEPGDLPLATGVTGSGWKAATLTSSRMPAWFFLPAAAAGAVLSAMPPFRRIIFSAARRFYHAEEAMLQADPADWHEYVIEWRASQVAFQVDGQPVLLSRHSPAGPLGMVIWIDNQYAVASAEKGFRFGVLPLGVGQSLEIADLRIEAPLPA